MKPWVIYTLADPRAVSDVRYVGKTSCQLKDRLWTHLAYAKKPRRRSHLVNWLLSLLRDGLVPEMVAIDRGTGDWQAAERRWIAHYRALGYALCNSTDGGEGGVAGQLVSAETRAKRSAANTGRVVSAETRAKMSAARRGRGPVLTPASYEKMSRTKTGKQGPKPSAETIAKRTAAIKITWVRKKAGGWRPAPCNPEGRARTIAANTGRLCSPETRAKISAANKGRGAGRKLSTETCQRMSDAQKRRHMAEKEAA